MGLTFGAFKRLYAGRGIYYANSRYNIEGNGEYRTIAEARTAIDEYNALLKRQEEEERRAKAASGNYLVVSRQGDRVTVQTPKGPVEYATMRAYRQSIFDLEEEFQMQSVWEDLEGRKEK